MPAVIQPCEPTPMTDEAFLQNSDTAGEGKTIPETKQSNLTLNKAEQNGPLFKSVDEFKTSIERFFYGNLSLIGQLWIRVLTAALVGAKLSLFPTVEARSVRAATVHAATVRAASRRVGDPEPEKPPKMKYTDLPFYDYPHRVYKDHLEAKSGCPQSSNKIIHMMILPYVTSARKVSQKYICSAKCKTINSYHEVKCDMQKAHKYYMKQLRDPENLLYRSGIVVSTATLCCIASGKGNAKICYHAGNGFVKGYSFFCASGEAKLRPRGKCKKDLPDELEDKSKSVCKDPSKK